MEMDLLNMESLDKYNKNSDYYTAGYEFYSAIDARFLTKPRVAIKPKTYVSPTFAQVPTSGNTTNIGQVGTAGALNPIGTTPEPTFTPVNPLSIHSYNPTTQTPTSNQSFTPVNPMNVGNTATTSLGTSSGNTTTTSTNTAINNPTGMTTESSEGFPMGGGFGGGGGAMPMPEEQANGEAGLGNGATMKSTKQPMSNNMKLGLGLLVVLGGYLIYKNKSKLFA